ncbi:MAG: hypothetical protein JNM69_37370 [Archangium sp.]|nr:hypothetical protein [Archangium sp.]
MSAESNEQLLRAWYEAREALDRFAEGPLDELGRQRRDELRAKEEALAVRVRAAGLIPERTEQRSGVWAPLPMHDAPPAPAAEEIEFSDWKNTNSAHDTIVRRMTALYEYSYRRRGAERLLKELDANRLSARSAALVAAAMDDFEMEFDAASLRARHQLKQPAPWQPRPPPVSVPAPFVPDERDGLTAAQRRLVEVLAGLFPEHLAREDLLERVGRTEEHERALAELLLPRPYPLVVAEGVSRYRLSALAMELIDRLPDGGAQVHGGFFPNLLVNGCAQPLTFPTHHLAEIVEAAKLIANHPGMYAHTVMQRLPGPDFSEGYLCAQPSTLYESGQGVLALGTQITFENLRVVRLERFPPEVSAARVVEAIQASGLTGVVSVVESAPGIVRYEVEHPVFARAVLRFLDQQSLLVRSYQASLTTRGPDSDAPETSWLGHLLMSFFNRTKMVIAYRLVAEEKVLRAQLEQRSAFSVTPELQRVIDRVLDVSLDHTEAVWGLTRLGTAEFRAHAAFKHVETNGHQPLSEGNARRALKTKKTQISSNRIEEERESLSARIRELEARIRSPDLLYAEVCSQLDRIVEKYGTTRRRTLLASRASLTAVLHVQ